MPSSNHQPPLNPEERRRRVAALLATGLVRLGSTLRAPADGMVTILPNWRNQVGWSEAPEFKEGDRLWPGAVIAELPDLSSIQVTARVDEIDRGRVKVGQAAKVRIDAVPDREFDAKVAGASPLAKLDFSNWPLTKSFDLVLSWPPPTPAPGMSANARIAVERTPTRAPLPRLSSEGRTVVYVRGRGLRGGGGDRPARRSRWPGAG